MNQKEADEMIVFLREISDDLEPVYERLVHTGFDKAGEDVKDAMLSLFISCQRLQEVFPWKVENEPVHPQV